MPWDKFRDDAAIVLVVVHLSQVSAEEQMHGAKKPNICPNICSSPIAGEQMFEQMLLIKRFIKD